MQLDFPMQEAQHGSSSPKSDADGSTVPIPDDSEHIPDSLLGTESEGAAHAHRSKRKDWEGADNGGGTVGTPHSHEPMRSLQSLARATLFSSMRTIVRGIQCQQAVLHRCRGTESIPAMKAMLQTTKFEEFSGCVRTFDMRSGRLRAFGPIFREDAREWRCGCPVVRLSKRDRCVTAGVSEFPR